MKPCLPTLLAFVLATSFSHAGDNYVTNGSANATSSVTVSEVTDFNLQAAEAAKLPGDTTFAFLINGTNDGVTADGNLAALYSTALQAQKAERQSRLVRLAKAMRDERNSVLVLAEKSLVEREQERAEAGTAIPEASPATNPFSLSHPDPLVFNDEASPSEDLQSPLFESKADLANTPEPAVWALFGVGAAWLTLISIRKAKRAKAAQAKVLQPKLSLVKA